MDYLERIRHTVSCEVMEARAPARGKSLQGPELIAAEAVRLSKSLGEGARIVALDARGREFTSVELARWFEAEQNHGTREIDFVIGGAEGLGIEVARRAHLTLSLSRLTWTHEMCRVLLLEQIYRSFSILRNMPYHK